MYYDDILLRLVPQYGSEAGRRPRPSKVRPGSASIHSKAFIWLLNSTLDTHHTKFYNYQITIKLRNFLLRHNVIFIEKNKHIFFVINMPYISNFD